MRQTVSAVVEGFVPASVTVLLVVGSAPAAPLAGQAARVAAVRASEGELALPTTVERSPSENPPFDLFATERFNYPYTIRDALTDQRKVERYHALFLENEFLKVTVLPELGGHLYSCLDKISGQQMFYANRSIKKALIGYRGAWAAFGIEFNFPVSHNWMSMSPVDYALVPNADGSASIWVGNVDAVFGSSWRVELRLRPGRAVLEQHTTLFNGGDSRHRYYWWTNAAVEVGDDSELVYPTHLMATHGFTAVEPWPIDASGKDLRIIRNQTDGPLSLFTYRTLEPFIGVWHPTTRTGTMRLAFPKELPTSKVWSWGFDSDAHAWREALSDDRSAYIELQSGLFRNQETYAFLGPHERVTFSEYWLPVRQMDGVTRATVDAVFHAIRNGHVVTFQLNTTRAIGGARVAIRQGNRTLLDTTARLVPAHVWQRRLTDVSPDVPWAFELRDANGVVLLHHEEGQYDALTPKDVRIGRQEAHRWPSPDRRSDGDFAELGQNAELTGRRLEALSIYCAGLARFPDSLALNKAAGRLATSLHWLEAKASTDPTREDVNRVIEWLNRAYRRDTTDMETRYYLGLARAAVGDRREAREHLEAAQRFAATRAPARLQLARLAAQEGRWTEALSTIEALVADDGSNTLAGATEVALLRRNRQLSRARERCAHWRQQDPTSNLLRFEAARLGAPDADLWTHLAADPNRLLTIVDQYLALGAFDDAWVLLDHQYPKVSPPSAEPGVRSLSTNPLIAYYRAFVAKQLGRDDADAYRRASILATTYVFPNRASSYAVLNAALSANPDDGTARYLRGCLYLSSGLVTSAIADWERARTVAANLPALHRNLGMTLLHEGSLDEAIAVLKEGIAHDPRNVEVYTALDQAYGATTTSVAARVAALEQYPDSAAMPPVLVYKLALARAEQGDSARAESLFRDRFFPREEGGMTPERALVATRVVAARAAARSGRCEDALKQLEAVNRLGNGIELDTQAINRAIGDPSMQYEIAGVESQCGRDTDARGRRRKLAQNVGRGAALARALAVAAGRAIGDEPSPETAAHLQSTLDDLAAALDDGDTGSPGLVAYTRARILWTLGRGDEARQAVARVFVYPDRGLSHLLARLLREDLDSAGAR
jgi:tetratricopeptide (TPR) repeat protein